MEGELKRKALVETIEKENDKAPEPFVKPVAKVELNNHSDLQYTGELFFGASNQKITV